MDHGYSYSCHIGDRPASTVLSLWQLMPGAYRQLCCDLYRPVEDLQSNVVEQTTSNSRKGNKLDPLC